MKVTIRDKRQKQFAEKWLRTGTFGILHLCPRFGKTRVAINALRQLEDDLRVLIAYPEIKIEQAWLNAFTETDYHPNVTFTTFRSLYKYIKESFDVFIIDEIHMLSENQIRNCEKIMNDCDKVMGLSGTISSWTRGVLRDDLGLRVIANYTIDQAIKEGVLPDYEINIHKVTLDRYIKKRFGKRITTEKAYFNSLSSYIEKLEEEGKETKYLRFARMRVIQKSIAKIEKTKQLIKKHEDDRLLVFCGQTSVADNLDIPSHHSKSSYRKMFDDFVEGREKHLAVVRIGNTGVTYTPLNRVIMNYFDSNSENFTQKVNRCMSIEYDNPDKKAIIDIISSNEPVELKWLRKALSFFDKTKIKYL